MGSRRKLPPSTAASSGNGGRDDLHAAARSGDLLKVQSICVANPLAVNSRDRHSRTPLHLAAWSGHAEVVSYLCKNKSDTGAAAMDDTAAIHFACQKGHLEVVRVLLSSGASVKATNRKGMTPLHFAAQGAHLDLIKYLVKKGANVTSKNKSGQTPLDVADDDEVRKYLDECKQLVKKGEDPALKESKKENTAADDAKNNDQRGQESEEGEVTEKREGEEVTEESEPVAKKAKVSLDHLVAEDDTEDGNEE